MYNISNRQSFSPTVKVCDCTTQLFGNNTVSRLYGQPSRKALSEELRSDHVLEIAVFLNSKEEMRIAGIKLSTAHWTKNKRTYVERNVPPDPLTR